MLRIHSPRSLMLIGALIFALVLASCGSDDDDANGSSGDNGDTGGYEGTITFADLDWVSPVIHNRIAQFILEEGYGYETDEIAGTTNPMFQGMIGDDIDVTMEIWVEQLPPFKQAVEDGEVIDIGVNFDETLQGFYVPTYMIEGDAERGIEPMTPDLKHIDDLPQYADVFADPEDPSKGRIYTGIPGWEMTEIVEAKLLAYGLDETYNGFLPGSSAALMTSLVAAYEQGEPWIGQLWEPYWIFSQVDMTMIEEPEYNEECWEQVYDGEVACAFPAVSVHKAANPEFAEQAPDVMEFLENYETSVDLTNEAMLYMEENGLTAEETALWFLREHEDMWTEWVPEDVATKVSEALEDTP